MTPPVIAIDGPAASGKSSTAAAVARALGAIHLDSGALYRGLTRVALDLGSGEPGAIARSAEARELGLHLSERQLVPFLDGRPAESRIRGPEVTAMVSEIAALPGLRDWVNRRLRAAAAPDRALVLEGRDIGTVVFPEAPVKVFLTATPEVRAGRRLRQLGQPVDPAVLAREAAALAQRDRADSERVVAPLRRAADAAVLDTTDLGFEEQVARIVDLVRRVLPQLGEPGSLLGSA